MALPKRGKLAMIDAVIPARNEEATISAIVETLANHPWIGNIVVACDSCTDDTQLRAIFHGATGTIADTFDGKGQAVQAGLSFTNAPYVLFTDADFTGLTHDHITAVCKKAWTDQRFMVIGVPEIPGNYPTDRIFAWPWVSGLRCVPTSLVKPLNLHGYLME